MKLHFIRNIVVVVCGRDGGNVFICCYCFVLFLAICYCNFVDYKTVANIDTDTKKKTSTLNDKSVKEHEKQKEKRKKEKKKQNEIKMFG